ncbi:MAG: helicase-exonuclease AddAB subunit AddB [Clostridia bacterium]|nr:helicase-exonuclease AddAB subunit AddB [Clostridia bacterium]
MSLRLICGRSGTGKSEFCLNETIEKLNNQNKIYIITPEQFSYSVEKKLIDKQETGAIINAEVLTFKRMAHRVEQEVGKTINTNLSKSGKAMLIYSILVENKKNLKFLGKAEQNIDLIDTALTEFKKHSITVKNLKEVTNNEEDKYLKEKLKDLSIIYEKFEEKISGKLLDENDVLTILAKNLEKTNMFKDCTIYIDEFTGYTKQEYKLIETLLKTAKQINITVTTDNLDLGTNPDTDIFYSNKQTADKLLYLARKNNIECEKTSFLEKKYRYKSLELDHIEKSLYTIPYNTYKEEVKNISLFLASNQYSEIENVAKEIIKLVKNKKYRYREISIITKNLPNYASLIKAIFKNYDIPVFIDEKKELSQNIFMKYIISILDIYAKSWSYDSIINYIKTGFLRIDNDEIYMLENYTKKWGIKGSKWYTGEWNFEEVSEENKEKIERIQTLRKQIITPLVKLREKINENKTVSGITKKIYEFLIENEIDKILLEKKEKLEEQNYIEIANEQELAWNIMVEVFDELTSIFGEEKISFEKYMNLVMVGLNKSGLGRIPQTSDQVIVGDIERSRTHKVKAVFILGMNDGVFPSVNKNEGFLGDKDREKLKEKGIELAKGTLEMLYEDNFAIYKAFTTAEEKLFLSYTSSNLEGGTLRPSILITKIKRLFPNLIEESDMVDSKEEIINKSQTFELLIEKLRNWKEGEELENAWIEVYKYFSENEEWKYKLEGAVKALNYTNTPENISKENIEKLYGNTLNTTVSRLEQYKSCPFSYYLKYGLKLHESDNFKVQMVDTGNFMHEVIDSFFNIVRQRQISIKEISEKETEEIINEIIEEKLQITKNYIFTSTDKYKVLTRRLKRVILKSMKYILESLKDSDFEVFANELEFKKGKAYEPIRLNLEDGKKVEITGKIDRVDLAKTADGNYIRIIDYKSSVKNIDLNEVYAGLQLQLLTYLDATCKIEEMLPAGVLYFNLIDPIIKSDKYMTDEQIELELKKKFKMNGIILADVKVVKMMDKKLETGASNVISAYIDKEGNLSKKSNAVTKEQFEDLQKYTAKIIKEISQEILSGDISLKPYYNTKTKKKPCDYCEYKSICQFDVGKNGNNYNYISKMEKDEILEKIKNVK